MARRLTRIGACPSIDDATRLKSKAVATTPDIHYSVSDPHQLKLATEIFTWQPEIHIWGLDPTNVIQPVVDIFNSLFVGPGVCLGISVKRMECKSRNLHQEFLSAFKHYVHVLLKKYDSHSAEFRVEQTLCLIVVEAGNLIHLACCS